MRTLFSGSFSLGCFSKSGSGFSEKCLRFFGKHAVLFPESVASILVNSSRFFGAKGRFFVQSLAFGRKFLIFVCKRNLALMFRRLSWLFLFLLPLAAVAAGEDGDTLSVTWVDGRKFVMIGDRGRPVFDCFFEDERAYVERLERDSANLFLDRFYRRAQDSAVSIPDEEGRHDIVIPEMQVKICYPSRPYWLMAFYSALSEESLEKIERIKEAQIVLNFVYDQSGKIVYMRFHMVGEHWLSIPLEEWARLALSMEKYVLLYDIFKHSEDRPERYFVKQDFFVLYLYLLLDPRQNFDF